MGRFQVILLRVLQRDTEVDFPFGQEKSEKVSRTAGPLIVSKGLT